MEGADPEKRNSFCGGTRGEPERPGGVGGVGLGVEVGLDPGAELGEGAR